MCLWFCLVVQWHICSWFVGVFKISTAARGFTPACTMWKLNGLLIIQPIAYKPIPAAQGHRCRPVHQATETSKTLDLTSVLLSSKQAATTSLAYSSKQITPRLQGP